MLNLSCRHKSVLLSAICFLLLAGFLPSCSEPPPPSEVYIPGDHFSVEVSVSISSTRVSVDEPLILHGERRSSGFIAVPLVDVPEGVQWWRSEPPAFEEEVAGNLRWVVKPESFARFNTDFRADLTREVKFSQPGTYTLSATSNTYGPEPVLSDQLIVTVVP
jgi:hypothetical protein